jgi:hypothetical protein
MEIDHKERARKEEKRFKMPKGRRMNEITPAFGDGPAASVKIFSTRKLFARPIGGRLLSGPLGSPPKP